MEENKLMNRSKISLAIFVYIREYSSRTNIRLRIFVHSHIRSCPSLPCSRVQMEAFFRTEYGHRKKFVSDKFRAYFAVFLIFPDDYR